MSIKENPVSKTFTIILVGLCCFILGMATPHSRQLYATLKNYIIATTSFHDTSSLQKIHLTIDDKSWQKLTQKRKDAFERGYLKSSPDDYVKAKLTFNNLSFPIKLRHKGDTTTHLQENKWSFRIKCSQQNTLLGMKVFSIQHPEQRQYLYEWVYHQLLKKEGLIHLRYDFINVHLNNKDLGIFAIEEHFDQRLLKNNKRPHGPILRIREDVLWDENYPLRTLEMENNYKNDVYLSAQIDSFQSNKYLNDPILKEQTLAAIDLLEKFRQKKLTTSDVFDTDQLATYMALSDLMGALHGLFWRNSRYYFNPVTKRFEPIGYDAQDEGRRIDSLIPTFRNIHTRKPINWDLMFSDEELVAKYLKELERVSHPEYIHSFFENIKEEMKQKSIILKSEFPHYQLKMSIIKDNANFIQRTLHSEKICVAYLKSASDSSLKINIANTQQLPFHITKMTWGSYEVDFSTTPFIFPSRWALSPLNYQTITVNLPQSIKHLPSKEIDITLHGYIPGCQHAFTQKVTPWTFERPIKTANQNSLSTFNFVDINPKTREIKIKPGQWTLTKPLSIPPGHVVIAHAGTTIHLDNHASITSKSPFIFVGDEEKPIHIIAKESSKSSISLLNVKSRSSFQHVFFENLREPEESLTTNKSALLFYHSPVYFESCLFENIYGNNAVQVFDTTAEFKKCSFTLCSQNALTANHATVHLNECHFSSNQLSALHAIGSLVYARQLTCADNSENAITCTQASYFEGQNISISNSKNGFTLKDSSRSMISQISVSQCNTGFILKKEDRAFGHCHLTLSQVNLNQIKEHHYLKDSESTLVIDKKKVNAEQNHQISIINELK